MKGRVEKIQIRKKLKLKIDLERYTLTQASGLPVINVDKYSHISDTISAPSQSAASEPTISVVTNGVGLSRTRAKTAQTMANSESHEKS